MDGALVLDARTGRNARIARKQSGSTIGGQWKVHRLTDADQHKQQQRCTVDIPEGSSPTELPRRCA